MKKVFISYSHLDASFVERLRADISQAAIEVWIDTEGLPPGTDNWDKTIRAAIKDAAAVVYVASENAYASYNCQSELAIARSREKKIYPVFAQGTDFINCIPMGLTHVQYVDMRDNASYTAGLPRLLKALGVKQARTVADLPAAQPDIFPVPPDFVPTNPYKGLEAFTADDRANFFGRSALVHALAENVEGLSRERFLAIVGPSGAGKSSIVMAGLLPTLHDRNPDWIFLPRVAPGDRPLEALAIMLRTQFGGGAISDYERDLGNSDVRGLIKQTKGLTRKNSQRIVLFIDQFEELFTQTSQERDKERDKERRQFIDLLTTSALDSKAQIIVILTLRADFTDRALAYDELTRLLQNHTQLIPPLSLADLREVIEEPARRQHLTFDPDLASDLIFAVRDQVGALPLLQFTLNLLYERRDGLNLTRTVYNATGGLSGALANHAESIYCSLPTDDLHCTLARWMFLRLIVLGVTEQDTTRRRAKPSELELHDPEQSKIVKDCVNTFINARLLTTNDGGGIRTIEVSHEALIRNWKRLGEWVHEGRDDIPLQQTISTDAETWQKQGKSPDRLYRGDKLAEAAAWATRNVPNANELAFIDAAVIDQQAHEADERERQARELELAQQTAQAARGEAAARQQSLNRLRLLAATVLVTVSVTLVVALTLLRNANSERDRALVAQAAASRHALISQSLLLSNDVQNALSENNTDLAITLAVQANAMDNPPIQAYQALEAAAFSPGTRLRLTGHTDDVWSFAFSLDGKYISLRLPLIRRSSFGMMKRGNRCVVWSVMRPQCVPSLSARMGIL